MTRSRRKSVPLLAREAAETAIVRKFNGNIGDEGSAHRDLFNAWCASAEEDFLRRLYVHLTDGELDAFSSTNGAPFNPHMPGPGPTDAEWCLSPSEQEKALGLLSQRPPEERLKLSADVRPSGVPALLRELPPDAPIYWRVTCAGWRSESHRTAAQCIADIEERITRQAEGFFLLCEAAQILVDSGRGRSAAEWKDDFLSAYAKGDLPIYKPSNRAPIAAGKRPYPPNDLVHIAELDAWLLRTTKKGFPGSPAISSPGQCEPATPAAMAGIEPMGQLASPRDFRPWETLSAPGAHIEGLFFYHQAAREIADANGWSDDRLQALLDAMAGAINGGALRSRDRKSGLVRPPQNLDMLLLVTAEDVNDWLSKEGAPYRWAHVNQDANLTSTSDAPAFVVELSSIAPVRESTSPPPLTTPDIADAFDGIDGQTAKQWRAKLGDVNNHQWLIGARAVKAKAPKPAAWWPIVFAELLLTREASFESLNRAFLNVPKLKAWLPAWQERRRERNAFGQ